MAAPINDAAFTPAPVSKCARSDVSITEIKSPRFNPETVEIDALCRVQACDPLIIPPFENPAISDEAKPLPSARGAQISHDVVTAVRLFILTGARRQKILSHRWEEVGPPTGRLELSDGKTGAKFVHLPERTVERRENLPRPFGNPFVRVGGAPGAPARPSRSCCNDMHLAIDPLSAAAAQIGAAVEHATEIQT